MCLVVLDLFIHSGEMGYSDLLCVRWSPSQAPVWQVSGIGNLRGGGGGNSTAGQETSQERKPVGRHDTGSETGPELKCAFSLC